MQNLCHFEPARYTTAPHQTEGWIVFRGPSEKVFERVSDHATIGDWVPLVEMITVTHPHPVAPDESSIGTTRAITLKGGLSIVEKVVFWNPPYCYAYSAEGKHFPFSNYVGLFFVEPSDDKGGRCIFREYFNDMGRVKQAVMFHGAVALGRQALGNLARLIGGTEYAMTTVSHVNPGDRQIP